MTGYGDRYSRYAPYAVTALVLSVALYIRIRLLAVPLERDEGEFAYMGQLLLKGIPPYTGAYTMKLPGVSVLYAFFMMLFGQTPAGVHTGLLIVNGISIGLIYLLAQRLFDRNAALFSCAGYAVLSLGSAVNGIFAHATHFVVLFALAGFLLLLLAEEKRSHALLLATGFCFGLAFTMKQHAAVLSAYAVLYFLWRKRADKEPWLAGSSLLLLGMSVPSAGIALWMAKTGSFGNFWFWTVQYAREYAATPALSTGWSNFTRSFGEILQSQAPVWLLAGYGVFRIGMKQCRCADRMFLFGFVVFSCLAVCPGLIFRSHYHILLLPSVALLSGAGACATLLPGSGRFAPIVPALIIAVAASYLFYQGRACFFTLPPQAVSHATYGNNPFPEAQLIAEYVKKDTTANDRIAVLGSEPELYFYADRLAATGHIYTYGLMEDQPYAEHMQAQMIREIEAARPRYFIVVNVHDSWLIRDTSNRLILDWGARYIRELYDQVGVAHIIDQNRTRYYWGAEAAGRTPESGAFLSVYKRKSGT